jgi:hypothetical protein
LGNLGFLPVGLNLVARVRLEYPPPTIEPFLVIAHTFFIAFYAIIDKVVYQVYVQAIKMDSIFYIAILIMSIVIHEVSHGFMAEYFGDNTARYAGRLTLNPIKHLDPFGSVILPALVLVCQVLHFFLVGPSQCLTIQTILRQS